MDIMVIILRSTAPRYIVYRQYSESKTAADNLLEWKWAISHSHNRLSRVAPHVSLNALLTSLVT